MAVNPRKAYTALAILFAINMMNFFDRQLLGVVGEKIRVEWSLSDTALGLLGTAFTLIYAFVGLPLGRLSDSFSRTKILGVGVFVWSLMTAASGVCKNFVQLFIVRLGVGVGEASCAPAAASLIGDLFPASKRSNAMSVFMMGLPLGLAGSYLLGGLIEKKWGWQATFYIAAVPGIVLAALAWFLHEPQRGASETHNIGAAKRPGWAPLLVLSIPTMIPIILSGALHNFNMYAIGSFLASFLIRYHEVSLQKAANIATVVYGLSGIPGLLFGGMAADWLTRKYANGRMLLSAATFLGAVPLTYFALVQPPGSTTGFLVLMGAGICLMYVYYAATYSTIQDLVEPSLRGTAMAIYFFAMYLLGASFGPVATGMLSDHYTQQAAIAAGVTDLTAAGALEPYRAEGIHSAMMVIPIINVVLTVCMIAAAITVAKDLEKLQTWMREAVAKAGAKPEEPPAAAAE